MGKRLPEGYDDTELDDSPRHIKKSKKHAKRFGFEETVERQSGYRYRRWFRTAKARDQALADLTSKGSTVHLFRPYYTYRKIER